ncbi:Glycerol-3-phosphate ABC transporter, ATP-binding protein UgpC [Labilithrix luteola]|uniref:Glycerol-3-phosphate ABC transporter, ATP-binding protein UgpC n=1 Tax=Labilithrix luteola TaxID=1391654 RepID=A0A0K1Q8G5_9BACT|nr:Glycerol-3-phosphate ABC transporter, ATP-binding protein UgpC [Labilithrix luteola]
MSEAEVELDRISKRFDGDRKRVAKGETVPAALRDISFSVAKGEFLVVVGPSGCGKSTTLRIVAGLEEADSGSVRIGGRAMERVPPQDRDVAMVFQGYALYPQMTVRENIQFPLKMRGIDSAEREKRTREAAEMLRLGRLLDRLPAELSGGERQRVAMGRAIVRRPRVFLFDEPLSNLDAALRQELRVEIGVLVRQLGVTAIYVTHDQVEAMTLADRICVMREGRVLMIAPPRAIYERPATSFVATFLGAPKMNLLRAASRLTGLHAGHSSFRDPRASCPPMSSSAFVPRTSAWSPKEVRARHPSRCCSPSRSAPKRTCSCVPVTSTCAHEPQDSRRARRVNVCMLHSTPRACTSSTLRPRIGASNEDHAPPDPRRCRRFFGGLWLQAKLARRPGQGTRSALVQPGRAQSRSAARNRASLPRLAGRGARRTGLPGGLLRVARQATDGHCGEGRPSAESRGGRGAALSRACRNPGVTRRIRRHA